MMDTAKIRALAEERLAGSDLFVVDVTCSPANEVEVLVDSDSSVAIEDCVELSRAIEASLDRDVEDFALTVSSAGIGQPLRMLRQYRRLIGRPVEVVLLSGVKLLAELRDATEESVTLAYEEKVAVEGKKRKQLVETVREYPLSEVKSTREYIDFK
ncbi:ribosome assembly cofactor RimP [Gallalistipes aquisgranensis]|uniref:ribosome assembly cofactor RimP n=1 Tax=Gallalistipes aquisgranensis TaxID=2779358 RepID=UPI001CF8791C|nr:ribosome assembly cofactor RimP [Gallalistipes aquisgranensis]MBE5032532.1 ribosome assembly cofactor RimP [Gallalistipes aquisgranensis]